MFKGKMFNLGAAAPPDKSGLVDLPHCFHVLDTLEKDRTNLLVSVELFYNQSQSMIESWSKLLLSLSEVVMNSPNNNPIGKEYIETFQKSSNADLKIFANYIEASISPLIHQLKGLQVQYEGLKKKKKKLKHSTTTKGVGALLAVEFQQQINSAVTNRDFALWRFCKSNFDSKMKYAFEAHIQYSSVQGSFRKLSSKLMKMKKDSDKSSSNEAWNNSLRRSKELSISAFFQNRKIDEKDESSRYINPDELKRLGGEGNFWSLDNVMSLSRYSSRRGVLHITTYRMVFLSYGIQSSQKGKIESPSEVVFDIPLALIGRLEEIDQNDDFQIVQIFCKDLRNLVISFTQSKHSVNEFITNVSSLVFANTKALFAYFYRDPIDNSTDGWSLYDPHNEYKRLGIPDENFRITSINADYSLSPSYPSVLVVPMGISDADIKQAAPFRSKKRIISICWRLIGSNLAIARCSQPLVGVVGRRNSKDEAFLSEISRMATQQSNHRGLMLTGIGHGNFRSSPQSHIMILDARPKVNAVANLASGGGWENVEDLHTEVQFLNIDNIHVVRESLETMRKLFLPGVLETDYLVETHPASNLFTLKDWVKRYQDIQNTLRRSTQSSSWFRLLQTLLSGAIQIAQFIDMEKRSVVVHCSDGWDRTSQLTSLAQLLLDSHYRTISGFAILIEKEWLSFGHKFAERYGHGEKRTKFGDKQRSPIFIQWLDAVFQILMQKPNHFEFTVELLVDIAEHLYSCRFGTFLENNERERKERSIPSKTISLWTWLLRNPKKYLNPNYNRSDDVIIPYTSTSEFFLWVHYYQRWDSCSFSKVSEISLDLPAEFFKSQSISPAISKHQQIKIISQKYAQGVFVPPPPPPGPPPSSEHLQAHSRVPRISPDRLAAPISVNLDDMSLWYDQQSALIGQELQLDDNDNDNELDDADLN